MRHKQILTILLTSLVLTMALFWLVAGPSVLPVARAANFTIQTTADAADFNPGNGICQTQLEQCTLRAAIQEANALAGPDTITMLPTGVYSLSVTGSGENGSVSGDLDITDSLTINGEGAGVTIIDANGADRALHILTGTVVISGVTVRNGFIASTGGGGIVVAPGAELTLINSAVINNESGLSFSSGGGIENNGTLTLVDSLVGNNQSEGTGGGINNTGNLSLSGTTVSSNTTLSSGGGLRSSGDVTLTGSTVTGNSASGSGGGISNGGGLTLENSTVSHNTSFFEGGGLSNGGNITLINSTVSNNSAFIGIESPGAGGGISNDGLLSLLNSTVAENVAESEFGGGILITGGSVQLQNSIVANNGPNCSSGLESLGNNLASDNTCGLTASGDITNTNPLLGPLQNNGGRTDTHALLPGSPAIDAADSEICPAADQRGVTRPQGAACDMGAFELAADLEADLTAIAFSGPALAQPGQAIEIDLEIANQGNSDANGVVFEIYLTPDQTIDAGDLLLNSGQIEVIPANQAVAAPVGIVEIPPDLPPDGYFLGLLLDPADTIPESDEANNTAFLSLQITDFVPEPAAPLTLSPDRRLFIVTAHFVDVEGQTTLVGESATVNVAPGYAHARFGDPPQLRIQLIDDEDNLADAYNAWDPLERYGVGGDSPSFRLAESDGRFVFPFASNLDRMEIIDISDGIDDPVLIGVIPLNADDYCEQNPDDAVCQSPDLIVNACIDQDADGLCLPDDEPLTGALACLDDETNCQPVPATFRDVTPGPHTPFLLFSGATAGYYPTTPRTAIELSGETSQEITLGAVYPVHPKGVAVHQGLNKVYVAFQGPRIGDDKPFPFVAVIDGQTDQVQRTIPGGPDGIGRGPWGVAVQGNNVYVSSFEEGRISVIDANSDTVQANVSPERSDFQPTVPFVNEITGRVHFPDYRGGRLVIVEGAAIVDEPLIANQFGFSPFEMVIAKSLQGYNFVTMRDAISPGFFQFRGLNSTEPFGVEPQEIIFAGPQGPRSSGSPYAVGLWQEEGMSEPRLFMTYANDPRVTGEAFPNPNKLLVYSFPVLDPKNVILRQAEVSVGDFAEAGLIYDPTGQRMLGAFGGFAYDNGQGDQAACNNPARGGTYAVDFDGNVSAGPTPNIAAGNPPLEANMLALKNPFELAVNPNNDKIYITDRCWNDFPGGGQAGGGALLIFDPGSGGVPTPQPTLTPTASPTAGPTSTPTADLTATPTVTATLEATATPTITPTVDVTATPTVTSTVEATATPPLTPTITPSPTPGQLQATLVLTGPASVAAAETFSVTVQARDVSEPGLYGVQFVINFDPALISAATIKPNPAFGFVLLKEIDNAAGTISFVASQQGQLPGLSGNVTLLTFEATAVGASGPATFTFTDEKIGDSSAIPYQVVTQSYTVTIGAGPTATPTSTLEPTLTPVGTATPTPIASPTVTPESTATLTPTATGAPPTASPTAGPTQTPTPSPTPAGTSEPPTATPTGALTATPTPVDTTEPPTATPTGALNQTPTPTPTPVDTSEPPTATPTGVLTATPTPVDTTEPPTATPTGALTQTPTPTPVDTTEPPMATPIGTATPTPVGTTEPPTATPTGTFEPPTATPTADATATVQPTLTPQPTVVVTVTLSGQVILAGRANSDWSGAIVAVDQAGQAIAQATTDANGNFTIADLSPGQYTALTADASGFLPAVCDQPAITAPETKLNPIVLLSGDVNDDGLVDITDATAIGVYFNQTGPDLKVDINLDFITDVFDLILIGVNFGETTQEWSCLDN